MALALKTQALGSPFFRRSLNLQLHGSALPPERIHASLTTSDPKPIHTEGKDKPSVGFLGLGIMGTAMASNLAKAGFPVAVWNRTASKCEPLLERGAVFGPSPAKVASMCDITFGMLADPVAAIEVATGKDGVVYGLGPDKGYVDVSTVDAKTSKEISAAVKSTGALFLEAPVSGSKKPAEDGTLIFLTAGDRELFDKAGLMLDVMGKSRFFLGDVGNGAAMKLVVNMIMGSMMASFAEGLVLADKIGLDPNTLIEDLRLALEMAEALGQQIPVAASTNKIYNTAKSMGLGEEDFSAVIEALKGSQEGGYSL